VRRQCTSTPIGFPPWQASGCRSRSVRPALPRVAARRARFAPGSRGAGAIRVPRRSLRPAAAGTTRTTAWLALLSTRPHQRRRAPRAVPAPPVRFHPRLFGGEVPPAGGREPVVLRPLLVVRRLPLGAHEPLFLEAVERGIQRARFHTEGVVGRRADRLADAVA